MLNISYIVNCINTLEKAMMLLVNHAPDTLEYNIYRSACLKEFEIVLEQSNKLLKRRLKEMAANPALIEKLTFKDVLRLAVKSQIITHEACNRWFLYRDNRNSIAHDYGEGFANETLLLFPMFIDDARDLVQKIQSEGDAASI